MVLVYSTKLPSEDLPSLLARINTDWEDLSIILQATAPPTRYQKNKRLISYLTEAFKAEYPSIITKMVNLKIFMKEYFNDNCAKCILRMRKDIMVDRKHQVMEVINRESVSMARMMSGADVARQSIKGVAEGYEKKSGRIDGLTKQFVYNLKLRTSESRLKRLNMEDSGSADKGSPAVQAMIYRIESEGLNLSESGSICVIPEKTIKAMKKMAGKM